MLLLDDRVVWLGPRLLPPDTPFENGAHEWNRTIDLLLTKEVLYRLSYVSRFAYCGMKRAGWVWLNGAGDGNRTRTISLEG